MARANLIIANDLKDAFKSACQKHQTTPVRWIKATLDDVTISWVNSFPSTSDVLADVASAREVLEDSTPCFLLFCVTAEEPTKHWVLVTYVPEDAQLRGKMLYASGCRDVKSALGSGYFKGEVHVTAKDELTKETIYARVTAEVEALPFTEEELLMKEEMAAAARRSSGKESGIGLIPFNFDTAFDASLDKFLSGSLNLFEFFVASKEQVECGDLSSADPAALDEHSINNTEPRFYLLRQPQLSNSGETAPNAAAQGRVYFIFSCPEGCNVRRRMVHATSKAALIAHMDSRGLKVDKMLEISEPATITRLIAEAAAPPQEAKVELTQKAFSRPRRPGRGKARIIKPKQSS